MTALPTSLKILHIVLSIGETSAAYNEHCLPWADKRNISICTYFAAQIEPPDSIKLFNGNGTLRGFFHALNAALAANEYDVIHCHTPHVGLLFVAGTLLSQSQYASSTVFTVHDSFPNYKLRNRLLLIPVFATFRRVVCCSNASYASFPAFYKWLAGERLSAVPNGLDIARVDHVADHLRGSSRRVAGFKVTAVSRLVPVKNPFTLIAAIKHAFDPASQLVYVGDGSLRDALQSQVDESALADQVEFTGLIPREEVFRHLLDCDLFVSTSRGEGLPVSVLEAMACACPVVLSDIPPHREIAEQVDFIPLVPVDDIMGFAKAIVAFREMSSAERAAIGQKCRELVERRFSLSAMHAGYTKIYEGILSERLPYVLEAK